MTAPRTWDVTLRFVDNAPTDEHPIEWVWGLLLNDVWTEVAVESISAKEVKTWRFGDVVTEDNKPDVPFNAVDQTGRVRTESQSLDTGDTWRLIWLDGQELVCAATC